MPLRNESGCEHDRQLTELCAFFPRPSGRGQFSGFDVLTPFEKLSAIDRISGYICEGPPSEWEERHKAWIAVLLAEKDEIDFQNRRPFGRGGQV